MAQGKHIIPILSLNDPNKFCESLLCSRIIIRCAVSLLNSFVQFKLRIGKMRKIAPNKFCESLLCSRIIIRCAVSLLNSFVQFNLGFTIVFILSTTESYAGAWLPEVGTYNLYSSHSILDARSRKIRNIRKEAFIDMQNEIQKLSMVKALIYKRASDLRRELLNSERRNIEQIKRDIDLLEQESSELTSFSDDEASYFELEYGLADDHSFGTKLGYKTDKFADLNSGKTSATKSGREIDIFYKYKFFDEESWVATIRPKIHFSTYDKRKSLGYTDFELLIGHSRIKKNYGAYFECGITARKYYGRIIGNSIGYVLSIQEGIKFGKGFTVSNYTEYEKAKFVNILYRRTIYDQVSIAKELVFDRSGLNCFTAQIGYFWKGSLVDRFYTVSGPIFSVWLNL